MVRAQSSGWERLVEVGHGGAPKPGLVATQPGSVLALELNTAFRGRRHEAGAGPGAEPPPVLLSLQYLASYEHMGAARLACGGCCAPGGPPAVLVRDEGGRWGAGGMCWRGEPGGGAGRAWRRGGWGTSPDPAASF